MKTSGNPVSRPVGQRADDWLVTLWRLEAAYGKDPVYSVVPKSERTLSLSILSLSHRAERHICAYNRGERSVDHLGPAAWYLLAVMRMEERFRARDLKPLPPFRKTKRPRSKRKQFMAAIITLLVVCAALAQAQPCPDGAVCVRATATRRLTVTRTATNTRIPTRTPTTTRAPLRTRTPTPKAATSAAVLGGDWAQMGGGPGASGYFDAPGLTLPLTLRCSWEVGPRENVWVVEAVRHHGGALRLWEFFGPYGGYDNPWKVDAHQTAYYARLRDPATCAVTKVAGTPSARLPTWSGTWPTFVTFTDRVVGTLWEDGRAGWAWPSVNTAWGSLLPVGGGMLSREEWAHIACSAALNKCVVASWYGWHGGTRAQWLIRPARSVYPERALWRGQAWRPDAVELDDAPNSYVAIAEATRAAVIAGWFSREARAVQRGLHVYDIDTGAERCFLPGRFTAPAVGGDGRAYVVRNAADLVEVGTALCATRTVALPLGSPWEAPPVVASDAVYVLVPSLDHAADWRLTGDVLALDRETLAVRWRANTQTLFPQELLAYWTRADTTQMVADRDRLYVAGQDALLVLDRTTGAVLDRFVDARAPEGFQRLVRFEGGLAALDGYRTLQFPPCHERLCTGTTVRGGPDLAQCCRGYHARCAGPDPACEWNADERFRRSVSRRAWVME